MDVKLVILTAALVSTVSALLQQRGGGLATTRLIQTNQYTNTWVVQVLQQADRNHAANQLAEEHGFVNVGQVGNLNGYYQFKLLESRTGESKRTINQLTNVDERNDLTQALHNELNVGYVEQQKRKQQYKKDFTYPNDPQFNKQWSLVNTGQTSGRRGLDLNVEPVWEQGITGNGVVVSIMDDGMEIRHPDLSTNYDSFASWDFASNDPDPTPTNYFGDEPDRHGTSCAGEIAMAKDNNRCGVGVAYDSNIGCLKFNLSDSSDSAEANPLGYKNDYIQVYSNSWGPSDGGYIVDGPGHLLKQTFENAVENGRNGKGSIFVWAAGNGGWNFDSCAADGYASSIYTIGVGSADQNAGEASYDEQCTGKIAVTYSFNSRTFSDIGSFDPYDQISTTTLNGECTDDFTGTSASAPLVSGVIALALQANPNLTWRDVQYLLAYTSSPDDLVLGEWTVNGGGLRVSHKYGFGAVDAEALITRARRWTTVPPQTQNNIHGDRQSGTVYPGQPLTVRFIVSRVNTVAFLEHVVLSASLNVRGYSRSYGIGDLHAVISDFTSEEEYERWLQNHHPRRGDIMIELTSPQGTTSILLPYRKYDFINDEGYDNWPFMSLHHWSENPYGEWVLTISFKSSSGYVAVNDLGLVLYGSTTTPLAVQNIDSNGTFPYTNTYYTGISTTADHSTTSTPMVVQSSTTPSADHTDGTQIVPTLSAIAKGVIGTIVGIGILICIICLAVALAVACVRKRKERTQHTRYRILHSNDDTSAVPV